MIPSYWKQLSLTLYRRERYLKQPHLCEVFNTGNLSGRPWAIRIDGVVQTMDIGWGKTRIRTFKFVDGAIVAIEEIVPRTDLEEMTYEQNLLNHESEKITERGRRQGSPFSQTAATRLARRKIKLNALRKGHVDGAYLKKPATPTTDQGASA